MSTITADQITAGDRIIPAGRKRPVEVFLRLDAAENSDHLEFAAHSTNGSCALRLGRTETVQLVTD